MGSLTNILCRIGLHRRKQVYRYAPAKVPVVRAFHVEYTNYPRMDYDLCRRCGKRVKA